MLSRGRHFVTPWTAARQISLSFTNSQSLLKLRSIESMMPSNHFILCCPLLLLPSIVPSIMVLSNESVSPSVSLTHQEASINPYPYPSKGRQNENHNHRKLTKLITWNTALSNSMKLWAMPCRATQGVWVMVESSDKTWSAGEGNGKPLQYSCLENPMNSMKRQRLVGAQYATGDQWRNNSRKNEEMEPKQKQHPVMDVTGDGSKVWCYK